MLLLNGYWMLGNQQIFNGIFYPIDTSTSLMLTGHTFGTVASVS